MKLKAGDWIYNKKIDKIGIVLYVGETYVHAKYDGTSYDFNSKPFEWGYWYHSDSFDNVVYFLAGG